MRTPGGPTRGSQRSKNGKNWSLEELSWGPVWPFWAIQDPWIRTPRSSFSAITLYYSSCIRSVLLKCKFVYRKSRVGAKKKPKDVLVNFGHSGPFRTPEWIPPGVHIIFYHSVLLHLHKISVKIVKICCLSELDGSKIKRVQDIWQF